MNLANIMDKIADALTDGGVTKRAYAWPVETVSPPCAVVGYPQEPIEFDSTFSRGSDLITIPVYFIVGKASDRNSRDQLSEIIDGANSVKECLDGDLNGSVHTAVVRSCLVTEIQVAGVAHLAAQFNLEIYT
jgi:hypothetical protein